MAVAQCKKNSKGSCRSRKKMACGVKLMPSILELLGLLLMHAALISRDSHMRSC
jgi:hypothetical protein